MSPPLGLSDPLFGEEDDLMEIQHLTQSPLPTSSTEQLKPSVQSKPSTTYPLALPPVFPREVKLRQELDAVRQGNSLLKETVQKLEKEKQGEIKAYRSYKEDVDQEVTGLQNRIRTPKSSNARSQKQLVLKNSSMEMKDKSIASLTRKLLALKLKVKNGF